MARYICPRVEKICSGLYYCWHNVVFVILSSFQGIFVHDNQELVQTKPQILVLVEFKDQVLKHF